MIFNIFQIIIFLGFLIYVVSKWYDKMYVENLFSKPVKLAKLTPSEPPEMFGQIRAKIEKNFERQKNQKRFTYNTVAILISLSWIILWVNWQFDFVKGYYAFGAIGLLLLLAYHLTGSLEGEIALIASWIEINPEDAQSTRTKVEQDKQQGKKSLAIGLAIILAINLNWAYQIEKNENEKRTLFINELSREVGSGWCKNNDARSDGEGGFVTFGGWPCILIGSIDPPVFNEEDKSQKACALVSFNQENGLPESDSYELFVDMQEFCVEKEWGSYSVYGLKSQVSRYISPQLDELQSSLCSRFRFQLSYEESSDFCFNL
jgi:hypothetical protein